MNTSKIYIIASILGVFLLFMFGNRENNVKEAPASPLESRPISYYVQLDGKEPPLDGSGQIYTLDLFETATSVVEALHKRGKKVFCYVSVGTIEAYRPDASDFPNNIIGAQLPLWPDERYVDIRRLNILLPLMDRRITQCKAKGFDGVELDNVDAYNNHSGFPLDQEDQIRYNSDLAILIHSRGLLVGLKNAPELVLFLEPSFDFVVVEDCFVYRECDFYIPFIKNNKLVFQIEYTDSNIDWMMACKEAKKRGFTLIHKNRTLDRWQEDCR